MAKQFNWKEQKHKDLFPKWTRLKLDSYCLSLAYVYTQPYHSFPHSHERTSKHSQYAMAFKKLPIYPKCQHLNGIQCPFWKTHQTRGHLPAGGNLQNWPFNFSSCKSLLNVITHCNGPADLSGPLTWIMSEVCRSFRETQQHWTLDTFLITFYWERIETFRITRTISTLSPPPYYLIFLYKGRVFSFLEIGLFRNLAHFLENNKKKRLAKGIAICLWCFSKCGSFLLCHQFISAVGIQPTNMFLKHQWIRAHKKNPSVSMESISAAVVKKDRFFS